MAPLFPTFHPAQPSCALLYKRSRDVLVPRPPASCGDHPRQPVEPPVHSTRILFWHKRIRSGGLSGLLPEQGPSGA